MEFEKMDSIYEQLCIELFKCRHAEELQTEAPETVFNLFTEYYQEFKTCFKNMKYRELRGEVE